MGGRGSSFGRGGTSGGAVTVLNRTSLISARENQQTEVDQVLTVLRDTRDNYGVELNDIQVVQLAESGVMAYYDSEGNLAVNESYFDAAAMDAAYQKCVSQKFHPSNGSKSGLEAVAAHEIGHALTDAAGVKLGYGQWAVDRVADDIMEAARVQLGARGWKSVASAISGYAARDKAEAVAEAYADVYCNGNGAKAESRAVIAELERILRR